jgi:hypothetical protein
LALANQVGSGYAEPSTASSVFAQTGLSLNLDPGLAVRMGRAMAWVRESGLSNMAGGTVAVLSGFALISNPIGWIALGGALLMAGGAVGGSIGAVQISTFILGGTPEMREELATGADLAQSISSPGGLAGGVTGLLAGGTKGFEPGMRWGGRVETLFSLGQQLPRMYAHAPGSAPPIVFFRAPHPEQLPGVLVRGFEQGAYPGPGLFVTTQTSYVAEYARVYGGGILEIKVSPETITLLEEGGHLAKDLDPVAAARGSLTIAASGLSILNGGAEVRHIPHGSFELWSRFGVVP